MIQLLSLLFMLTVILTVYAFRTVHNRTRKSNLFNITASELFRIQFRVLIIMITSNVKLNYFALKSHVHYCKIFSIVCYNTALFQ